MVWSDGIFSMEGSIAPVPDLLQICRDHDAVLIIDDSHATGVLGRTGRNFGAGMSGGTAYVLDLVTALVNVDAVRTNELALDPLDDEDASLVEQLLRAHHEETGSPVAAQLLDDFPQTRARFTRLLPTEYARVRRALAQAEADGLDPAAPGVWDTILEVARG